MASHTTRIFLVRHGGTTSSDANRFAGASDPELSDAGRSQAAALSKRLATTQIDAAYCSDMKRAVATAESICAPHNLTPIRLPALREINHGHWEGQIHKEVEQKFAGEFQAWSADPLGYAPPGGETGLSVLARSLPAITQIVREHAGKSVLVVSHTATNRLLLCGLAGIDPRRYRDRLGQDLACLNIVDFEDPASPRVVRVNDISHYAQP
jgi:broad specificity phosphatase PhoE